MGCVVIVSLHTYARLRRLPVGWLRAEAAAGRIPYLRVGRLVRVYPPAVDRALARRASSRNGVRHG
jgi:hypothetical protein